MTTFRDLGVLAPIADALENVGITTPFPIQEMALPVALTGNDLIGQARTGTGKTFAFGLAMLQRIVAPDERGYAEAAEPGKPQALVIVPTRELAVQVSKDLETASAIRKVRLLTVYGGRAYEPQIDMLTSGVDLVVGTPGRLLDLSNQGHLDLAHIKVLVLDEADKMLDLGFLPDIEKLIGQTPELRQTMLFSATMPAPIVSLARQYLRHPLNIRAEAPDETQIVPATAQFVYRAHSLDKEELIGRLLQAENRDLAMIFCKTKRQTQRYADELERRGFAAAAVHGDLGQGARERALRAFRNRKIDVLVATDVAARGIDIEGVTHVVNVSCPEDADAYLHRIGRTGRAGASGVAITLVDWDDLARWKVINNTLGLPFPEPAETYSSSEHFFTDLGIPKGTKGMLPRDRRTRAGLDAEKVEDIGETTKRGSGSRGKGGASKGSSGSRNRRSGRGNRPSAEHSDTRDGGGGSSAAQSGSSSDGGQRRRRSRNRKRTRSGQPVTSGGQPAGN